MENWKEYVKRRWKGWLIGLFIVILLTIGVYYGVKAWLNYANSEAFKGEVNAAIITGIVGIITLCGTIGIQAYFNLRAQRLTVRDEIIRKRIEAYHQIYEYAIDVYGCVSDSYLKGDIESLIKGRKLEEEMTKYWRKNKFILSPEIEDLVLDFLDMAYLLLNPDEDTIKVFLEEQELNEKLIVTSKEIEEEFYYEYWRPLLDELEKEFGFKSVEKEIQDLRF